MPGGKGKTMSGVEAGEVIFENVDDASLLVSWWYGYLPRR